MSLVPYDEEAETPIGRASSFVSAVVAPGLSQLSAVQAQQHHQQQQLQGENQQLLHHQYELLASQHALDAQHNALVRATQLSGEQAQQRQQQLHGEQQQLLRNQYDLHTAQATLGEQHDTLLMNQNVLHNTMRQNKHEHQQLLRNQHDLNAAQATLGDQHETLLMNQSVLHNTLLQNKNDLHHAQQQTQAQLRATSAQAAGFARDASDAAVSASETQLLCVRKDMEQLWARLAELRQSLVGRDALDGARAAIAATRRSAERIEEELNDEVKLSERRYEEISTVVRANIKAVDRLMNTTNATKAAAVKLDATTQDHGAQILAQRHQLDAANEIANQQRAQQQAQLDHIIAQLQQQQQIIQQQQHDMLQLAAAASPTRPLNAGSPAPAFGPQPAEPAQLHPLAPVAPSPATIDPRDEIIRSLELRLARRHRSRDAHDTSSDDDDPALASDEDDENACASAIARWTARGATIEHDERATFAYSSLLLSRDALEWAWRRRLKTTADSYTDLVEDTITGILSAQRVAALSFAPQTSATLRYAAMKELRLRIESAQRLRLTIAGAPRAAYAALTTGLREARNKNRSTKNTFITSDAVLQKVMQKHPAAKRFPYNANYRDPASPPPNASSRTRRPWRSRSRSSSRAREETPESQKH